VNDTNQNTDTAVGGGVEPVVLATLAHPVNPQKLDRWGHLIFLLFASVIMLLSVLMSTDGKKSVFLPGFSSPFPDTCSSRRLLGIDCPGCGLTRAFICISHGQLEKAWRFNPASFVVYLFIAIQIPWHSFQIWRIQSGRASIHWPFIYWIPMAVAVILLANWVWTLARFPLPMP
jgi:hypothetical protein